MEKAAFDPVRFKEQERAGFNLVAERYEEAMVVRQASVARMVELAELEAGMRVLDVATGPGIVARRVAELIGLSGSVIGVDIAEEAIAVARRKAEAEGLVQATFEVADAESLQYEVNSFDRVFCSMGLMHFPAPETALTEFKRVLKTDGKLIASVWGEEADAPFIGVAIKTLARNFPPPKVERPSIFRFGKPPVLENLIAGAGFNQIQIEPLVLDTTFPDATTYWRTFLDVAGITTVALQKQSQEMRDFLEKDVATDLEPYRKATGGYSLPSKILLVRANA